jgi:hypothetical protein
MNFHPDSRLRLMIKKWHSIRVLLACEVPFLYIKYTLRDRLEIYNKSGFGITSYPIFHSDLLNALVVKS